MTVLSEMIKHHVKEEEQPDGMFAKARRSEMDLDEIGEQLQARKSELEADSSLLGKTKKAGCISLAGHVFSAWQNVG